LKLTENRSPVDESVIRDALRAAQIAESSRLAAPPETVWERIASMEGVNAELMPIMRMTFPLEWKRLDSGEVRSGAPLFRSTVLLLGIIPIDLHTVALVRLTRDRGFLERSSSLMHREWIHERILSPVPGGTEISDRVRFCCRLPALGFVLRPIIRFVFRHRHRQLRRHFGFIAER
jgi:ligand-binding SRPBCC domain-containing protein